MVEENRTAPGQKIIKEVNVEVEAQACAGE